MKNVAYYNFNVVLCIKIMLFWCVVLGIIPLTHTCDMYYLPLIFIELANLLEVHICTNVYAYLVTVRLFYVDCEIDNKKIILWIVPITIYLSNIIAFCTNDNWKNVCKILYIAHCTFMPFSVKLIRINMLRKKWVYIYLKL